MRPKLYWCPGLQAKYFSSDAACAESCRGKTSAAGTGEIVGRWLMVVAEGPRMTFGRAVFFSNN